MISHPIVLFDGMCNLCNGVVNFLLSHDQGAHLRFASLQAEWTKSLLQQCGVDHLQDNTETIILVEPAQNQHSPPRVTVKSNAALRIAGHLARPWRWARLLWVIPRPIRDAAYDVIARNRYRWFGKRDTCRVPTEEESERFVA